MDFDLPGMVAVCLPLTRRTIHLVAGDYFDDAPAGELIQFAFNILLDAIDAFIPGPSAPIKFVVERLEHTIPNPAVWQDEFVVLELGVGRARGVAIVGALTNSRCNKGSKNSAPVGYGVTIALTAAFSAACVG